MQIIISHKSTSSIYLYLKTKSEKFRTKGKNRMNDLTRKFLKNSIIVILAICFISCDDPDFFPKGNKIKSVDVGVKNVCDKDIEFLEWTIDGKHSFAAGGVKVGDSSTHLFYEYFRGGKIAELEYLFSGDNEYTTLSISIEKILTPELDGSITIYFQISYKTTDVEIGLYKFVEEQGKTKLKKIKSYIRSPIGIIKKTPVPKSWYPVARQK